MRTNIIEVVKDLTPQQRAAYETIVKHKKAHAQKANVRTYRSLLKRGLIIRDPHSTDMNDFILNGKPVELPPAKETYQTLIEKVKPVYKRPPADHTNTSREQHVQRWLNVRI
jgi:hypothetical protein